MFLNISKKYLLIILCLSFVLLTLNILNLDYKRPNKDRRQYLEYSYNILKYGDYRLDNTGRHFIDYRREPIWPSLIMIGMVLHPNIDIENQDVTCFTEGKGGCINDIIWLNLINILMLISCALISSLFLFKCTNNIYISIMGLLMIGLSGNLTSFAVDYLSEITAAFLIFIVSLTLYTIAREFKYRYALILGLTIGVLSLTKAIFYYFLFFISFCLVLYWMINGINFKIILKRVAVILIFSYLVIGPWITRNYLQIGNFSIAGGSSIVLTTRADFNDLASRAYLTSIIYYSGEKIEWIKNKFIHYADPKYYSHFKSNSFGKKAFNYHKNTSYKTGLNGIELDDLLSKRAIDRILNNFDKHIFAIIPLSIRGLFAESGFGFYKYNKGDNANLGEKYFNVNVNSYYYDLAIINFIYVFCFVTILILAWLDKHYSVVFFLLPGVYLYIAHVMFTHYIPRYSAPLIPICVICANLMFYKIFRLIRNSYPLHN